MLEILTVHISLKNQDFPKNLLNSHVEKTDILLSNISFHITEYRNISKLWHAEQLIRASSSPQV